MQTVYEAANVIDAHLVRQALEAEGIPAYVRGEALAGEKHFGLDFQVLGQVADVIKECVNMGVQIGVVIGGGNFWRGVKNGEGHIERTRADHQPLGLVAHGGIGAGLGRLGIARTGVFFAPQFVLNFCRSCILCSSRSCM